MNNSDLRAAVRKSLVDDARPDQPARDSYSIALLISRSRDEAPETIQPIVQQEAARLRLNVV